MARTHAGWVGAQLNGYVAKGKNKFNPEKTWLVHNATEEDFAVMRGQVT